MTESTSSGESAIAEAVKQLILKRNAYVTENLKDMPGLISSKGALEFWSSGGFLKRVPAQPPIAQYDFFNITLHYVEVIELSETSAVALYYAEGSLKVKDGPAIPRFMARATEIYVKEGENWLIRSTHWSTVSNGQGLND